MRRLVPYSCSTSAPRSNSTQEFISMWRIPPCRNPAVIRRHHWPCIIGAGRLAPHSMSPDCGFILWTRYSAVLISRIRMVVKRACGIRPPSMSPGLRCSTARCPSCMSQYGHTLSPVVTNARQFGHIRRLSTDGYCTVRVAVLETPPTVALMVAVCVEETAEVPMVNVALVCPDGTVTNAGTCASNGLSLNRSTRTPPEGAGAERVTVLFVLVPPWTMLGLTARFAGAGRPEGLMVSRAALVTPPYDAPMATVVKAVTVVVGMVNA